MVKRTFRINDYLYTKLRTLAKEKNMSINKLMIKLIGIGYTEDLKFMPTHDWRIINEKRFKKNK